MEDNLIDSPLVPGSKAILIKSVSIDYIKKGYKYYNVDVNRFFTGLKRMSIYRCQSSGYEFYYPNNVTGDSEFYEAFQRFDWYYMPWKWEHELAASCLTNDLSILEVGCAHGAFLTGASNRFNLQKAVGLELNESAPINNGQVQIINQTIQDFEKNNHELFDVVCSFQVLEHISEVHSFLQSMIGCLKPGGKLLISVPNNESFIGKENSVLNMPPHHVGRWNTKSLSYLERLFPIHLLNAQCEPLQSYHVESYINATYYSRYPKLIAKAIKKVDKFTGKYKKLMTRIFDNKESLVGHTVLVIFTKD